MIQVHHWWLWPSPMDLRKNIDSLMLIVLEGFKAGLQQRTAYVFHNRSGTRLKVLVWDGTGFWLCLRRLERGRFLGCTAENGCELNAEQFAWLVSGLDWKRWNETPPKPVWL